MFWFPAAVPPLRTREPEKNTPVVHILTSKHTYKLAAPLHGCSIILSLFIPAILMV